MIERAINEASEGSKKKEELKNCRHTLMLGYGRALAFLMQKYGSLDVLF